MAAAAGIAGGASSAGGGMMGGIANYIHTRDYTLPMMKKAWQRAGKDIRKEGRKLLGKQQVAYTTAGVRTDKGTALEVAGSTAAAIESKALRTMFEFEKAIFETRTAAVVSAVPMTSMSGGGQAAQGVASMMSQGAGWNGSMSGPYSAGASYSSGLPYYGNAGQASAPAHYSLPAMLQSNPPSYSR